MDTLRIGPSKENLSQLHPTTSEEGCVQARKRGALVNQFEAPAQKLYWNSIASVLYEAIFAAGSVVYNDMDPEPLQVEHQRRTDRGSSWSTSVSFSMRIYLYNAMANPGMAGDGQSGMMGEQSAREGLYQMRCCHWW